MAVIVERKHYSKNVSRERSIQIFLNDQPVAVSQGTPENLSELAIGFLLSEGLISDKKLLREIIVDTKNALVKVVSDEVLESDHTVIQRVTSAGCMQPSAAMRAQGFSQVRDVKQENSIPVFEAEKLLAMMEQLCQLSPKRNDGECAHACGVGNHEKLLCVREDIGRHNAMDKLIGQAWLDDIPMEEMTLFVTGRISREMALKALQSGVRVLVSHKSVTDSAIELAEEWGVTLVGKCRNNAMQVLSCHNRII